MRVGILILIASVFVSCISSQKYTSVQETVKRLQTDSMLLEKRILGLQDEVNYLANKSATMEQSLNQRLQEKQDSLIQKQAELNAKENRISDMKARKAQEQEAFASLSAGITKPFMAFQANELVHYTNCTQTIIEANTRLLFVPNTTKINKEKASAMISQVVEVLNKQPDLKLLIISHTDSVYTGKEKWEDNWALGSAQANALIKLLINEYKINPSRLIAATQADNIPLAKHNTTLDRNRIVFSFYSELLPCIHISE